MNSRLTKSSILAVSQDQVSADLSPDLSGEVVILDLRGGIYYELNGVGARIWELIQQPSLDKFVLDTLLKEYDVAPEQCEADFLALMEDMAGRGLVEVKDGPNP